MTRQRIVVVIAVLSVVGMVRASFFHFVMEPTHPVRHLDAEYRELPPLLPREGEVGFVTDLPMDEAPGEVNEGPKAAYLEAQYVVAPVILRYGDATLPLVVVSLRDPDRLDDVLRDRRLQFVSWAGPRVAVARPR
ncbi:MAG TPA: hypothetical protein VFE90_01040 [Myxococcales bacterium]|jgi:hypothetical protein|nr:hypothetical protein [Myxococcales bacterium]